MPCWSPALICASARMPCISQAMRCGVRALAALKHPPSVYTVPSLTQPRRSNLCCTRQWPVLDVLGRPAHAPEQKQAPGGTVRSANSALRLAPGWARGPGPTPGCGPRPPPSSTGAFAGCASCPWAGTRRACPSCSQSAARGRSALEGRPVRPTPTPTQPQACRCQASAPVQPRACRQGQRVEQLAAARATGRKAHRARVAVGDAVEPAWAHAGG